MNNESYELESPFNIEANSTLSPKPLNLLKNCKTTHLLSFLLFVRKLWVLHKEIQTENIRKDKFDYRTCNTFLKGKHVEEVEFIC